jgi:zinc transport system substrate-binding protein
LLGFWLCTSACSAAERMPRIVTTFLPAYCFAANVAGKAAQVENLLSGSVSLHDYQLSAGDIRKLAAADLIVVNGLGMETFLDKAIAAAGPETAAKIVRLSDGLSAQLIEEDRPHHHDEPGHHHTHNPHIWLDPRLASHCVTNLLAALVARDAGRAEDYKRNAAAYLEKLAALDAEIEKSVASIRNVPFITYHNAFPYFVRRYRLKLAGVVEQVPEVSPSPKDLSRLLATIRTQKVKALFSEPGPATRTARQIARDSGIILSELDPLEVGQFDPKSYEHGMRRNLETLVRTLGR